MSISELRCAIRTVRDFPSPGIQFKDITPILSDAALLKLAVDLLAEPFREDEVSKVVGVESRGFIFGSMVAARLGAGFVPVRKAGKLPRETVRETYDLEYGTDVVEMHADAIEAGDRVLIHDDVIATGGTAAATQALLQKRGAAIVGFSFLVELDELKGRERLGDNARIQSVLHF